MGRNWHSPKHYTWRGIEPGEMLVCTNPQTGEVLLALFNDGPLDVAVNAYWSGYQKGVAAGREEAREEIRRALGLQEKNGR